MRFAKGFCLLFFLAATLGLVCNEIPESLTLTDDVSNDFVADSSAAGTKCNNIALIALTEETLQTLTVLSPTEPALFAGPDLLRLLSIQRK